MKKLHLGIITGGPSLERGVSLNSARSLLDHLDGDDIIVKPFYVAPNLDFYAINKAQLYSNTPLDFDFKLDKSSQVLSRVELAKQLKALDLVFPVIHGEVGEDGTLQTLLEELAVPYVGVNAYTARNMFYKNRAQEYLREYGFATIAADILKRDDDTAQEKIERFFSLHELKRVIIKPIAGGSSIGVMSAYTAREAYIKLQKVFELTKSDAIIEPFCDGREFTVIVLQSQQDGEPVALIPTEIQISYDHGQIFDYRRKYLPTANTAWYCPPNFSQQVIEFIREQAERIFTLFGMRDFARLDGWVLRDGTITFTDLNPISGMEQNSFIFQQASRVGLTHRTILRYIVVNACRRYNIDWHYTKAITAAITAKKLTHNNNIRVLFGGATAERQVSLLSGTNVWLKLLESRKCIVKPYFLDTKGDVWYLPYTYALSHTVEEIENNCTQYSKYHHTLMQLKTNIIDRLMLENYCSTEHDVPYKMSMGDFLQDAKTEHAFIFIGLHGGFGENGELQQKLQQYNLRHNGSKVAGSQICMDKYLTSLEIAKLHDPKILALKKLQIKVADFINFSADDFQRFWYNLSDLILDQNIYISEPSLPSFIIKPQCDGCSAGIIKLNTANDLYIYIDLLRTKSPIIPPNTFINQPNVIEMSCNYDDYFIIEPFIETDKLIVDHNKLTHIKNSGYLELTIGLLEHAGNYHVFNPSISIAANSVLSLEEKFQGGTGINITPPPEDLLSADFKAEIKQHIIEVAKCLRIKNYARIDLFANIITRKIIIIEANTLPALTPSTVLYHQALAEDKPIYPIELLEKIIEYADTNTEVKAPPLSLRAEGEAIQADVK